MAAERYFEVGGPPSSPPTTFLLIMRMMKQHIDVTRYVATEVESVPAGTLYTS